MFNELPAFDIADPTLDDFRRVLNAAKIPIEDDEPGLDFVSFCFGDCLCYCGTMQPRVALMPLAYFDDTDFKDRHPFDAEYNRILRALTDDLGKPIASGVLKFDHRSEGQHYHYSVWKGSHSRLVLAQGERDLQFGLDLSLWFFYDDGDIATLIHRHY